MPLLRSAALLVACLCIVVSACACRPHDAPSATPDPHDAGRARQNVAFVEAPSASASVALPAPEPPFDPDDPAFKADPEDFQPKTPARPGDWLARFKQRNQDFGEYVRSRPTTRTSVRRQIVIQPLGTFTDAERELLDKLREYMSVFFDTPTRLAPPMALPDHGLRKHHDDGRSWTQYHTVTLMQEVLRPNLPADAVCYLGVTMSDLYPEEGWNYVFGQATLEQRVGVYSLARYFPAFWGEKDTPEARQRGLVRSFKVLAHETGHMFSLEHCTRYECMMNGSNSLGEMDRAPGFLCPVCLKKLQWNLRFDVRARYGRLRDLYRREKIEPWASWIDKRLRRIGPAPAPL
ncbi:MAG: hypothetical protein HY898_32810 [Deltaproteobacteria bacterium]|nr:hypothetical protein [Deltaproteobacteria bacterium]